MLHLVLNSPHSSTSLVHSYTTVTTIPPFSPFHHSAFVYSIYSSLDFSRGRTMHSGERTNLAWLHFIVDVTLQKKVPENKEELNQRKEEEDERTGEVDESSSGADVCSPALHTNEEATVTIAPEHDTLPHGEDLLIMTHLYLSITLPPFPVTLLFLLL